MSLILINPYAFPASLPAIGAAYEGGYFAGTISHTANGVATHALIVAPRATGASGSFGAGNQYTLTTNYKWKTTLTSTTGTTSVFDGFANTAAMETAGIASHPAANFCRGLSIGGFSDWYLPSRDELDIAYHNLKPSTDSNNTSFGINDYSVPKRTANYTSSVPGQTSVTDFRLTNSQPFMADWHWTSTQFDTNTAYSIKLDSGWQITGFAGINKQTEWPVRAFRRVAL